MSPNHPPTEVFWVLTFHRRQGLDQPGVRMCMSDSRLIKTLDLFIGLMRSYFFHSHQAMLPDEIFLVAVGYPRRDPT